MSDWSYYYNAPRSKVHEGMYGTTATPPRQYRMGGRRYTSAGTTGASDSSLLMGLLLLLGLMVLTKKK